MTQPTQSTINPNSVLRVLYNFSVIMSAVMIEVTADKPVDLLILDDNGVTEFNNNSGYTGYGVGIQKKRYLFSLMLPYRKQWHMFIINRGETSAIVNYMVTVLYEQ